MTRDPHKQVKNQAWLQQVILLIILCLALGLRFYRLDAQSFWNDEGNSARLSERSIPLIIEGTASDIHPPLYYLLLHGWRELLGDSEFGLRAFSAFIGSLTVAGVVALTKQVQPKQRKAWMVVGLLTAVNPALIYYSQEVRMYALLAFWVVLSTWLLFLGAHKPSNRFQGWMLLYVLVLVAGLYTHYFFPAVIIIHNLLVGSYLLERWQKVGTAWFELLPSVGRWASLMAAAFVLYLPWLPIFFRQSGGLLEANLTLREFALLGFNWLAFGETFDAIPWISGLLFLLLFWSLWANGRSSLFPAFSTLFILLFMYIAGTTRPAFFKFLLTAVPFFVIWLALGVKRENHTWINALYGLGLAVLLFAGNGRSLQNLYTNPDYARADYRQMAQRIAFENHPNAGIILDAPNQWEVFTYYHQGDAPVYPLPRGFPKRAEIEAELSEIATSHDRIYAIFWGEAQRDPERIVESWLDANAFKATDEWVRDVRFVTYAVPSAPTTEIKSVTDVQFGEAITLRGYTLARSELVPGDIIEVSLFWETAVSLEQRYKVFLHLLDENGQLIAQRDSEPGGGLTPTNAWTTNAVIQDNHGILLPSDMSDGTYQLLVGLYDLSDPASRLPYVTDSGEAADALLLTPIHVRK